MQPAAHYNNITSDTIHVMLMARSKTLCALRNLSYHSMEDKQIVYIIILAQSVIRYQSKHWQWTAIHEANLQQNYIRG